MRELQLPNSDKPALVDDEDYDRLRCFNWYVAGAKPTNSIIRSYKVNKKGTASLTSKSLSLASEVMNRPGTMFDHKDRNPFNNQKFNLRECNQSQNCANREKCKGVSKWKGVSWTKRLRKWQAAISINKKQLYLGIFTEEKEAALAYNAKAKELFGEFAVLNIV